MGKAPVPWWARICVGLGSVLLLASVGTLVAGRALLGRYESGVHRVELLPTEARGTGGLADGPLNLLVVGSDLRAGLENEVWRSDTVMIVHVPRGLDRAYVLSLPRDLQVEIPRCPDAPTGCTDKLNAAFAFGGAGPPFDPVAGYRLLAETVRTVTGLRFDAAAIIDFTGFTRLVGALGGIRLCVDTETTSIHTGMSWSPGCYQFNGHSALDYLRQRDFPDGDATRQRHQQQFVKALLAGASEQRILTDPVRLDRVLRAAGDTLTLDSAYSVADLLLALRRIRSQDLTLVRFPVTEDGTEGTEAAEPLLAALRDGTVDRYLLANPELVNRGYTG